MQKVFVLLDSVDKATSFVKDISNLDFTCDLISGRYVIDPKSIMGVLSLDLTKPLELQIRTTEGSTVDYLHALRPYILQSSAS
jgi:phosphotransferase system HPr-like phosphotransfer protein